MSTFDYNINNYSISELKSIVDIPEEEQLTYPIIHTAVAKRLTTAANNPPLFRFFTQLKDQLTKSMDPSFPSAAYDDDEDDEDEDEDEDEEHEEQTDFLHHNLLSPPPAPLVQAQIHDGVPFGNMNPLDRTTVSKVVCIDSVFRDAPDTTSAESFLMNLPDNLDRVISLSLTSINLPTSWYNVPDNPLLNIFHVKTFNIQGMLDTMYPVTVPAGNYTAVQMAATLNNIFSNTNGLHLIHVEIHPVTLKTIFRAKTSIDPGLSIYAFDPVAAQPHPNFYYEVHFQTVALDGDLTDCDTSDTAGIVLSLAHNNIGYILGFRKPEYVVPKLPEQVDITAVLDSIVTYHCILRSEGVFDTNVIDYIFLELDDFNKNFVTNTVVSKTQRDYIGNNIMAQIPVYSETQQAAGRAPPGNQITFKTRSYFGPVRIEKLAVRILDKHGALVDLRGNNFSFTVEVILQYS